MTTRINGGIITDQMLSGSFRYFKMTGTFVNTVGQGTVATPTTIIPGQQIEGGNPNSITQKLVQPGAAVANSVADRVFRVITSKCTVLLISLISDTEIHFVAEAGTCGWETTADIKAALVVSGVDGTNFIGTKVIGDPAIPNSTAAGAAQYDLSTIAITEVTNPVFAV